MGWVPRRMQHLDLCMLRGACPVRLEKGTVSVTDGPFIEGKELIPGFTVIQVDSKEEAIEWVTRLRQCMGDGTLRMAPIRVGSFDE